MTPCKRNPITASNQTTNGHHQNGYVDVITSAVSSGELSAGHHKMLTTESAISDEAIQARGYFTQHDKHALELLGFTKAQALPPALVIPLYRFNGEQSGYVIRPDIARNTSIGNKVKYESLPGVPPILDVAPLTRDQIADPQKPLIITEGAKKADAAASRGLCAINLNGVYGFRDKNTALPDWEFVALKGRPVFIAYDSDVTTKAQVTAAMRRLHGLLQTYGAIVKVICLPEEENGAKTGLDDFFARGGTVEELFTFARDLEPLDVERRKKKEKAKAELMTRFIATEKPITSIKSAEEIPPFNTEYGYRPDELVKLLYPHWQSAVLSSHQAHAERIRDNLGKNLRYCKGPGWIFWNSKHWEVDGKNSKLTATRVVKLSAVIPREAATLMGFAQTLTCSGRKLDSEAMSKAASKHFDMVHAAETRSFIDGALHFAAGMLSVDVKTFDLKPWTIGFQNGVWCNGKWREHRRKDYLLSQSPVTYDPEADQSEWLAVLERMTGRDRELSKTLQDIAGYVLSGASHLRTIPWVYGGKGTGKSTFAELLKTVLDHEAVAINTNLLSKGGSRGRLGAVIWNKRLVMCSEAGNQRIDAELLKTLAGGDTLTVEFKYKESFDAKPHHVLMMIANDPPEMDAYDGALKDRVKVLPFTHPLKPGSGIEDIKLSGGRRIEEVRSNPESLLVQGFCAWAMAGLERVYRNGDIYICEAVEKATRKFWSDTDQLTPFWESIDESELQNGIGKVELYQRYKTWCECEGTRPKGQREFSRACVDFGLTEKAMTGEKKKRYRGWVK